MELDWTEFLDYVVRWANTHKREIGAAWPKKGGWEGWAQVAIPNFIESIDDRYVILREEHVYKNNRLAADYLINQGIEGATPLIVELKCQSLHNHSSFNAGLLADIKKTAELKDEYSGAALLIIGIFFTNTQPPGYFNVKVINDQIGIVYALEMQ